MTRLLDPDQTRIVKSIPLPYSKSLTPNQLFRGKTINIELLI